MSSGMVLSVERPGGRFRLVGQDVLPDGEISCLKQNLGDFDNPVDTLVQFMVMTDVQFFMLYTTLSPAWQAPIREKVRIRLHAEDPTAEKIRKWLQLDLTTETF